MSKIELLAENLKGLIPDEVLSELQQAEEISPELSEKVKAATSRLITTEYASNHPDILKAATAKRMNGMDAHLTRLLQNDDYADIVTPEFIEELEKQQRTEDRYFKTLEHSTKILKAKLAEAKKAASSKSNNDLVNQLQAELAEASKKQEQLMTAFEKEKTKAVSEIKRQYEVEAINSQIYKKATGYQFQNDAIRDAVLRTGITDIHDKYHLVRGEKGVEVRRKDDPELQAYDDNTKQPITFEDVIAQYLEPFKPKNNGKGTPQPRIIRGGDPQPQLSEAARKSAERIELMRQNAK